MHLLATIKKMIDSKIDRYPLKIEKAVPATDRLLGRFERKYKCNLPLDFKEFLRQFGNYSFDAVVDIIEPNPNGNSASFGSVFGFSKWKSSWNDIRENTEIADGWPVAIPFASDAGNNWFYLYLGQNGDKQEVYFYDAQKRASWGDDYFFNMFPSLHPAIKQYLEDRKNGKIKPKGAFEHFYLLSHTFAEFLKNLKPDSN